MDTIEKSKNLNQKEFESLLDDLCDKYYNNVVETDIINDKTYDKLVELYENKFNTKYSKVGAKSLVKCKLPYYMGSLDKIKKQNSLDLWIKKNTCDEYVIMDKIDGISVLYVNDGNNDFLYKRSDGIHGTNITHLLKYFKLPKIKNCAVRGELVLTRNEFKKYQDKMTSVKNVSNARNMVSGITNSKELNVELLSVCSFIAFQYLDDEKIEMKKSIQLSNMKKLGFTLPSYVKISSVSIEILHKILQEFKSKSTYEIDGLVISANINSRLLVNKNPKNSMAFKEDDDGVITTVQNVEWNLSKNGVFKPTIIVDTVEIDDVKISRATAHNAKFVVENGIGKNAKVEIVRSGKVIPYIKKVIDSVNADLPDIKLNWIWNETKVDIILVDKLNSNDVNKKQIVDFFKQLDAKFLGEKTINKLCDNQFNTLKKIFNISIKDLLEIDGIKDKLAKRIRDSIQTSIKNVSLCKIMSASQQFGPGFAEKKIGLVLNEFPNILEIYGKSSKKDLIEKIKSIKGMKTKTEQFVDNLPKFIKFIKEHPEITIKEMIARDRETSETKENDNECKIEFSDEPSRSESKKNKKTLENQVIVFTGFRDKSLEEKIIKLGGRITSTVSGKTTILIKKVKKNEEETTKEIKAEKLGIKIMEYNDFITKYT
jgi:DNA ligase (NAD+)